jgi:hypothetical protein
LAMKCWEKEKDLVSISEDPLSCVRSYDPYIYNVSIRIYI